MHPHNAYMTSDAVVIAPSHRTDEGFSFVELLVALSLLLITLVAVMGLSTTSSFMAGAARQRASMVNAAAGYLERVRQEPFANIGTPSGTPTGGLVAVVTTSTPYVITVTPSVSWGRPEEPSNHAFKTVTLSVVSSLVQGGSQMTYSTSAIVADVGTVASIDGLQRSRQSIGSGPPSSGAMRASHAWGATACLVAQVRPNRRPRHRAALTTLGGAARIGVRLQVIA